MTNQSSVIVVLSFLVVSLLVITIDAVSEKAGGDMVRDGSITTVEVKGELPPIVVDEDFNYAYTKSSPLIPKPLTKHLRKMDQAVYEVVKGKAYTAVGYGLCSTTMIIGDRGLIIIDPGENNEQAEATLKAFRKISEKPISAVVYTHRHPDHPFGVKGLGVTDEDVKSGKVKIVAQKDFIPNLINDASVVGAILTVRTGYSGGNALPKDATGMIGSGLGPTFLAGHLSLIEPNVLVDEEEDITIDGVPIHFMHAYGDAEDELAMWFPSMKLLHGAETIQGTTFPNIYSIRGTKYRDPVKWYNGIKKLLKYAPEAEYYTASHMRPWIGNAYIVERLTNYHDAIQYVHDQTVRYMNKGYIPDEIVEVVKLPDHLANDPWLAEFYGTVNHSARNIYNGYLGFFEGDPKVFASPGFVALAELYVDAMGGRAKILADAKKAIADKQYGWAMEILTYPIRIDHGDMDARKLKAEAMRQWAYEQENTNWRTHALSGAMELEGKMDTKQFWQFASPDIIKVLPASSTINTLRVRLMAEKTQNKDITMGFDFTDTGEQCGLQIRRGVAVFHPDMPSEVDVKLVSTKDVLDSIVLKQMTMKDAIDEHKIKVEGSRELMEEFFSYFEPPSTDNINIVVR
ncbi:Metallo-beta-lactamase superfamily protein [Poriferisphaera corsica]|uniref:Metallo-beta-lactamase superfamily protein n=1 Tax=Poriferisphaera corsica TaxID=2528020 RepID=A0A517YZ91_9BACT|nr:alkyl sulfatase dimerization domain-containing protein [Poriferisphaera corsica]QDU35546.1 Metallo-beta-lactamase superfamily protein [Poriferisphaera corsica]